MAHCLNQRLGTDIAEKVDDFCQQQVWAFQEHLTHTWTEIKKLLILHVEALQHESVKLQEELAEQPGTGNDSKASVQQRLRAVSFVPACERDVAFIDALQDALDPASDSIPLERSSMDKMLLETSDLRAGQPHKFAGNLFPEAASNRCPEDSIADSYQLSQMTPSMKTSDFNINDRYEYGIKSAEISEIADKASIAESTQSRDSTKSPWRLSSRGAKDNPVSTVCRLSSSGKNGNDFGIYRTSKSGLSLNRQISADDAEDTSIKACCSRMLKCKEFELAIAVTIMINAFIMCWECQYQGLEVGFNLQYPGRQKQSEKVWAHASTVFSCFDWFFGCLFLAEMILKLLCWRSRYFYDSRKVWKFGDDLDLQPNRCQQCLVSLEGWNLLDFSCVAAFLFDKLSAGIESVNPQMIRLLRLFRLFRMVRLVRFLETLDHLYIMTTAISGVKHVLVWAIVLLTVMLLTCDLFLVQILHATYFDRVDARDLSKEQLDKHHEMYAYFGTCTRCMLSMFEITLGNWPPVARLLSEEASEWFTLFCLVHKLTIGFAVISVITGVILQETFKVAQTDDVIMFRQKKMANAVLQKKLRALFYELDKSGDGTLDLEEIEALADLPEIRTWLSSLGIETNDLKTLFALIDADGDGYITLEEMISRMPRLQGNARSIDLLAIQKTLWNNSRKDNTNSSSRSMQSCFADFLLQVPNPGEENQHSEFKNRLSAQSAQD